MPDYKKMYLTMAGAVEDVVCLLEKKRTDHQRLAAVYEHHQAPDGRTAEMRGHLHQPGLSKPGG